MRSKRLCHQKNEGAITIDNDIDIPKMHIVLPYGVGIAVISGR